jgi:hypothetical protein
VVTLAAAAPAGARFGVHLCLGDMNHKAYGRMTDAAPLVQLANAIAARWPAGRPIGPAEPGGRRGQPAPGRGADHLRLALAPRRRLR